MMLQAEYFKAAVNKQVQNDTTYIKFLLSYSTVFCFQNQLEAEWPRGRGNYFKALP